MSKTNRIAIVLCASLFTAGLVASPAVYAADAMKDSMHKHTMKKHDGMMKSDSMHKGGAMKPMKTDGTADTPAQ